MKIQRVFFYTICLCLCYTANLVSAQNVMQLAKEALVATVQLEMADSKGAPAGFGNGFFVKPNTIATNYHIIQGAAHGTAKLLGRHRKYLIEEVIATDKENDLALLKVSESHIKPLPLIEDSGTLQPDERIYVAGYSNALEGTFSNGRIHSRVNNHIKITAPISTDSSGGAVLNRQGEVIGVALFQHTTLDAEPLNLVILSNHLKALMTQTDETIPLSRLKNRASAETYFHWGYANYHSGNYLKAIEAYTMIIHLDPDNVYLPHNNRAMAKVKLKQYYSAIADYNTALKLNPEYANAYTNRGIAKAALGNYRQAIADYDTTIKLKPDYALAYSNRGIAKAALGQYQQAVTDYDTTIKLKPDYALAYTNRGIAKAALGKHDEAIADYDIAIQLNSDYAPVYNHRGVAKTTLDEYETALRNFNTAIKLNPNYADAYSNRGMLKAKLGQYQHAIADYDVALKLNPNDGMTYYNRGVLKIIFSNATKGKLDLQLAMKNATHTGNTKLMQLIEQALTDLK